MEEQNTNMKLGVHVDAFLKSVEENKRQYDTSKPPTRRLTENSSVSPVPETSKPPTRRLTLCKVRLLMCKTF